MRDLTGYERRGAGLGLWLPERAFHQLPQHDGDGQHVLVALDAARSEPHARSTTSSVSTNAEATIRTSAPLL